LQPEVRKMKRFIGIT